LGIAGRYGTLSKSGSRLSAQDGGRYLQRRRYYNFLLEEQTAGMTRMTNTTVNTGVILDIRFQDVDVPS